MTNQNLIDAYIQAQPQPVQPQLRQIRALIREEAPDATEKISYGMPTFFLNHNLVHFAAAKNHLGFYPSPSAIRHFQERLSAYPTSKGAVRFPLDQELPQQLIREMVRFRVHEELEKK